MVSEDLALQLLGSPSGWLGSAAGAVAKFIGTAKTAAGLPADEDFEENVRYLRNTLGPDFELSRDLPTFHSGCGFEIGAKGLVKDIDTAMKAAIMVCGNQVTQIQKQNHGFISWKELQKIFDEGFEFDPQPECDTDKSDFLSESGLDFFKFDGGASTESINKATSKMQTFVNDPAIWKCLKIDKVTIAKLFGQTGAAVQNFETFFAASDKRAHIAIDCGAVRFPKTTDPWFRLYRFRVIVSKSTHRVLYAEHNEKTLNMTLTTRKYGMNKHFMEKFEGPRKQAVDDKFDKYLQDLGL